VRYEVLGQSQRNGTVAPARGSRIDFVAGVMAAVQPAAVVPVPTAADPQPPVLSTPVTPNPTQVAAANDAVFRWKMVAGLASVVAVATLVWQVAVAPNPGSGPQLALQSPILGMQAPVLQAVVTERGVVEPARLLGTHRFDFAQAEAAPGWQKELAGIHIPETEEYGIGSFVYRARRPFHPERLWHVVLEGITGTLRAKGFFWIASRPEWMIAWAQAGQMLEIQPVGHWFVATPSDQWALDDDMRDQLDALWHPELGDRRQELVFIGQQLDRDAITATLDACLLSEQEMALGASQWLDLRDPFPAWALDVEQDGDDELDDEDAATPVTAA
jgi:hypothetical protein